MRAAAGLRREGRWVLAVLLLSGLALASRAAADEPAPQAAPPPHTVTVRGTVPDLSGRWLVVVWLDVKAQGTRTNPIFWQLRREGEDRQMTVRFVSLPKEQQERLDEANRAKQGWQPSSADLAAVAAAWDTLPPRPTAATQVTTTMIGRDAFDDTLTADPRLRDALFIVQQAQGGEATGSPVMQQTQILAALAPRPGGGYTGNSTTAVTAAAPFPVSITFEGTFTLYSLDRPTGLLARLLDLFSGCRR